MEAAAKRFEFVEAAMYRDQMLKLQQIETNKDKD